VYHANLLDACQAIAEKKEKGQSAFCGQWTTMAMHRRSLLAIFDGGYAPLRKRTSRRTKKKISPELRHGRQTGSSFAAEKTTNMHLTNRKRNRELNKSYEWEGH
jgi:hypothetical protein